MSHSLLLDNGSANGTAQSSSRTRRSVGRTTARPSRPLEHEAHRTVDGSAATVQPSDARSTHRALLREDPELEQAIPAAERDHAIRTLRVHVRRLAAGPVDIAALDLPTSTFALLITDGMVTVDVLVGDRAMTQLLIDGDVLLIDPPSPTAPASSRLTRGGRQRAHRRARSTFRTGCRSVARTDADHHDPPGGPTAPARRSWRDLPATQSRTAGHGDLLSPGQPHRHRHPRWCPAAPTTRPPPDRRPHRCAAPHRQPGPHVSAEPRPRPPARRRTLAACPQHRPADRCQMGFYQ